VRYPKFEAIGIKSKSHELVRVISVVLVAAHLVFFHQRRIAPGEMINESQESEQLSRQSLMVIVTINFNSGQHPIFIKYHITTLLEEW
jgi:hypothetical protein